MRRKRYQQGSLKIFRGRWIAQWWEEGHRRSKTLGRISTMTKSQAQNELSAILSPINGSDQPASPERTFEDFVEKTYLRFYRRKWKRSTVGTNEDRLKHHLTCEFSGRTLGSFTRDELQDFLDRKATELSFSTVDHLRWDLRQIFSMAVAEDCLRKNPAALLFTPKNAKRAANRVVMTWQNVNLLFSVLEERECLVCMLATVAGMRPGEIFGLKWRHVRADHVEIDQRLYRGKIDTPKTDQSERNVALSEGLQSEIAKWRSLSGGSDPEAWVFPSETMKTPLSKDNCWRRWISPRLKEVGLGWVNFQVMRRTHASLMRELNIDPKIVADQLGHSVDVNLNTYTKTALGTRKNAVNGLESALRVM